MRTRPVAACAIKTILKYALQKLIDFNFVVKFFLLQRKRIRAFNRCERSNCSVEERT
jgi:hypothetical protein